MHREVVIGQHRVSIRAEPKTDEGESADVAGYAVRYTIARTDGAPVRPNFPTVCSYELNLGTSLFPSVEAALEYGLAKARDDIATFEAQQDSDRRSAAPDHG